MTTSYIFANNGILQNYAGNSFSNQSNLQIVSANQASLTVSGSNSSLTVNSTNHSSLTVSTSNNIFNVNSSTNSVALSLATNSGSMSMNAATGGVYFNANGVLYFNCDVVFNGNLIANNITVFNSITANAVSAKSVTTPNVTNASVSSIQFMANFSGNSTYTVNGTFTQATPSKVVTATINAHGLITNNKIYASLVGTSNLTNSYVVTVTNANVFTFTAASYITSGNISLIFNPINSSFGNVKVSPVANGTYAINFGAALPNTSYTVSTNTISTLANVSSNSARSNTAYATVNTYSNGTLTNVEIVIVSISQ